MNAIVPSQPQSITPASTFDDLVSQTVRTVAKSSERIYRQTYTAWQTWCTSNGVQSLDMRPGNVSSFLASTSTTKATRQRQLSAMRKLTQMAYILMPSDETRMYHEALKVIKAPAPDTSQPSGKERTQRALAPHEAQKILDAWETADVKPLLKLRNCSLIAVLLLSGIRRSEAAALRWSDVDFENGILHIRHGKGDKRRDVPLAGDFALDALAAWRLECVGREWVFCAITPEGTTLRQDKPMAGNEIYRIWERTGKLAGIESKPHDARRTLITELLTTGTPVHDVQAVAGHARGETTLRYARSADARQIRKNMKVRYG